MFVGKRIAEERKRKGLSQSAFAELAGVSFSSQRRYEDGRSTPDTEYIENLRKIGVDVDYVLTGDTASELQDVNVISAYAYVIQKMAERIGCPEKAVWDVFDSINGNKEVFDGGKKPPIEVIDLMFEGCNLEIDGPLLSAILQGVDEVTKKGKIRLPPGKKAGATVILYRAFKANGKVDPVMIEEAVKLAAA